MFRSSAWALGLLTLVSLGGSSAMAEEAVLAEFYGSGVHQYFSGNSARAVADLTAAIKGGTKDPRAYYFRALAQMRQGNQAGAQADLQKGAALESADANQFYPVGKSLERVQGSSRMAIERYRTVARAEALQRQLRRDATRYEDRRRAEARVLRAQPDKPVKASATEPAAAEAPADAADAPVDDPFADDAKMPEADAAETDTPEPPAEEMPAAEPAEEMPAEADATPEAADSEDPFGQPAAKEGAEEAKDEAPAAEQPPAAEPPAAEAPAADAKPAAPDEDPFADEPAKGDGK